MLRQSEENAEKKEGSSLNIVSSSSNERMTTSSSNNFGVGNKTSTTDHYYKEQIEKISKENKQLKQKLDLIETENKSLKKSLFEISTKYDYISQQLGTHSSMGFNLDSLETLDDQNTTLILNSDNRKFDCKYTLKGHLAAIFVIQFSPCGKFVASGSFDKTSKIWEISSQKEISSFSGHSSNVVDISWSSDSQETITASYDSSVKVWDLTKGKLTTSIALSGFVQSVMHNPSDNNTFFAGTTHSKIFGLDKRDPERIGITFQNNSMINSLWVCNGGQYVYSGDGNGEIKFWDSRKPGSTPVFSYQIDTNGSDVRVPISHIHFSPGDRPGEDGQFIGVNSYDNVLRILQTNSPRTSNFHQVHQFTGYKNKNWPIRSAFYRGKNYQKLNIPQKDEEDKVSIDSSFLIATGSAESYAYIYDVGNPKGRLIQKLRGHQNRIYCTTFHPSDPILATSSADSTIKLWSCGRF